MKNLQEEFEKIPKSLVGRYEIAVEPELYSILVYSPCYVNILQDGAFEVVDEIEQNGSITIKNSKVCVTLLAKVKMMHVTVYS